MRTVTTATPRARAAAALAVAALLTAACAPAEAPLRVLAASGVESLVRDFTERYRAQYPERSVIAQSAGSVELVERIGAGEPADLVFLSDATLFGERLQPQWTDFHLRLAVEPLVLARRPGLAATDPDWPAGLADALTDADLRMALADPARSALGYQARLVVRLTDLLYAGNAIEQRLWPGGREAQPLSEAYGDAGAAVEALTSGAADLSLVYRSLAAEAGLEFTALPDRVGLGEPRLAAVYARVGLQLPGAGRRPAGPVYFGVGMATATGADALAGSGTGMGRGAGRGSGARAGAGTPAAGTGGSRAAALDYLRIVLGDAGRRILQAHGLAAVTGSDRGIGLVFPDDVRRLLEETAGD